MVGGRSRYGSAIGRTWTKKGGHPSDHGRFRADRFKVGYLKADRPQQGWWQSCVLRGGDGHWSILEGGNRFLSMLRGIRVQSQALPFPLGPLSRLRIGAGVIALSLRSPKFLFGDLYGTSEEWPIALPPGGALLRSVTSRSVQPHISMIRRVCGFRASTMSLRSARPGR
jgi:hypothetical protein